MSIKERVQKFFKPKKVAESDRIEKIQEAVRREKKSTRAYLDGDISLEKYNQILEETSDITRIDLRRLSSRLR